MGGGPSVAFSLVTHLPPNPLGKKNARAKTAAQINPISKMTGQTKQNQGLKRTFFPFPLELLWPGSWRRGPKLKPKVLFVLATLGRFQRTNQKLCSSGQERVRRN